MPRVARADRLSNTLPQYQPDEPLSPKIAPNISNPTWLASNQGASSVEASDTKNHSGTNQPIDRPRTTAVIVAMLKSTAKTRKILSNIAFSLYAVARLRCAS